METIARNTWVRLAASLALLLFAVGGAWAGTETGTEVVSSVPPSPLYSQPSENVLARGGMVVIGVDCLRGILKLAEKTNVLSDPEDLELRGLMVVVQMENSTAIRGPYIRELHAQEPQGPQRTTCESLGPGKIITVVGSTVTVPNDKTLRLKATSISIEGAFDLQRLHEEMGSMGFPTVITGMGPNSFMIPGGFEITFRPSTTILEQKDDGMWKPRKEPLLAGMRVSVHLSVDLTGVFARYVLIEKTK